MKALEILKDSNIVFVVARLDGCLINSAELR